MSEEDEYIYIYILITVGSIYTIGLIAQVGRAMGL